MPQSYRTAGGIAYKRNRRFCEMAASEMAEGRVLTGRAPQKTAFSPRAWGKTRLGATPPSTQQSRRTRRREHADRARFGERRLVRVVVGVEQAQVLEINEAVIVEIALEPITAARRAVVVVGVKDGQVLEVDEAVEVQVTSPGELHEHGAQVDVLVAEERTALTFEVAVGRGY